MKPLFSSALSICLSGGWAAAMADITIVKVTGSGGPVEIVEDPLVEHVLAFGDRMHQYTGIPSSLLGSRFLRLYNADATSADFALELSIDRAGTLLLFLDNRIGDGVGGTDPRAGIGDTPSLGQDAPQPNPMSWVPQDGFEDALVDIGIDENGDGGIDVTSSVFAKHVQPGTLVLGPQNAGSVAHMYGIAFIPERSVAIFAAQPESVVRGDPCMLRWLVTPGMTVTLAGIGDVTAQTVNGWGAIEVSPAENTVYSLTARRQDEAASAATSVVVTAARGLVGWWRFDEVEGTVVHDSSGLGANGTLLTTSRTDPQLSSGSFEWEPAGGRFGGALFLDGVGGGGEVIDIGYGPRVEVPDSDSFEFSTGQSFTVAVWYRTDVVEDNQGLVTKGYDTRRVTNYWQLQTRVGSFAYDSRPTLAGDPRARIDSTPGISHGDAQWHHFVVVRDNVAAEIRLVVDGENVVSYPFADHAQNHGNWDVRGDDRGLMFGTHLNRFTRGWFDDIGIWRRALSSEEIQTIFRYGIQALGGTGPIEVAQVVVDRSTGRAVISWNSLPDRTYKLWCSTSLAGWLERGGTIPSQGFQTTIEVETTPDVPREFFRISEN
ncbi:MAG: LamG-like jellyroll fold domain-containing protein [Verrucomicrobiales bacterium]